MHSRQDSYYLSTNRTRTHWILWTGYYDDNDTFRWEYNPYAFCQRRGVSRQVAAAYLLIEGWQGEIGEYDEPSRRPAGAYASELLPAEQMAAVIAITWPPAAPVEP